jgi:hypothetical protein
VAITRTPLTATMYNLVLGDIVPGARFAIDK